MKSMKGLSMSRMVGSIRKKSSGSGSNTPSQTPNDAAPPLGSTAGETPESTAHNSVKAFCEAGGHVKGDEVLFLPPIVDAAESSPAAAAECARMIRKYMSKDYLSRSSWQYNAIMLMRILTDNPGETFTRNMDQKFVDVALSLLKSVKDSNVRQILMETMDDFENTKMDDQNLTLIITMWRQEKQEAYKRHGKNPGRRRRDHSSQAQAIGAHTQNQFARQQSAHQHEAFRTLPSPIELAGRLEEARTSAKLLEQVVMNTPPNEIIGNELIREFADRCLSASRSIQGYMSSQNPVPDNDTMESLIDTNEQLQTALNQHQRAMLNARKLERTDSGNMASSPYQEDTNGENQLLPRQDSALSQGSTGGGLFTTAPGQFSATMPPPSGPSGSGSGSGGAVGNGKGKATETSYEPPSGPPPGDVSPLAYEPPPGPPPSHAAALATGSGSGSAAPQPKQDEVWDDPFADPQEGASGAGGSSAAYADQRHADEPFHPGFGGGSTSEGARQKQKQLVDDDDDIYDSPKDKQPATRY